MRTKHGQILLLYFMKGKNPSIKNPSKTKSTKNSNQAYTPGKKMKYVMFHVNVSEFQ